jgi:DnaJ-class molecular chaperone
MIVLLVMVAAVIIFTVVSGRSKVLRNVCTRCEGTGEVNEKWPDPDAPGGWHKLDGVCPKCKGKGRV